MDFIKYRIDSISVEEFKCATDIKPGEVGIQASFGFQLNFTAHRIKCNGIFDYIQNETNVMHLFLACEFDIEAQAFESLLDNGKIVVQKGFLQYMASICVGAARGEIHARCDCSESSIANVVLPQINLTTILTEDGVFEIN